MKFSLKHLASILISFVFALAFISCPVPTEVSSSSSENENTPPHHHTEPTPQETEEQTVDPDNPEPFSSRTKNLDFIFGTESLAEISVTLTRSEWNHMLCYYDWRSDNEEYVHADFAMSKSSGAQSVAWKKENVGFRIRGNTSRCRPQVGWGAGKNDYNQAHFKIDFEEFLASGEEWKLSGCLKGLMLKRFKDDPTYAREIYGYKFFRANGIWTAPRAGYAHLTITITESDGTKEELDFGIYELIEPVAKQFVKARTSKHVANGFATNDGDVWKCTWHKNPPSLSDPDESDFGVEAVRFVGVEWNEENIEESTYKEFIKKDFSYDLKTNKKNLPVAKYTFISWIESLNALPDSDIAAIKKWYETHIDADLLLKTYAANVLLGMWDDYWNNNNNYYIYIDTDGMGYFIPYDYDNILGVNYAGIDWAKRDPINWSTSYISHPLIEKALLVPEYMALYKKYLLEMSAEGSAFESEKSAAQITKWHSLIKDKVSSPNLLYQTSTSFSIYDEMGARWSEPNIGYKIYTPGDALNFFEVRSAAVRNYILGAKSKVTLVVGEGSTVYENVPFGMDLYSFLSEYKITEPRLEDKHEQFMGWLDKDGIAVSTINELELTLSAAFSRVEDDKLPVFYDENNVGNEVKIVFCPGDWSYESLWMMIQEQLHDKSPESIGSVYMRGHIPVKYGDEWYKEACWERGSQVPLSYDEESGEWSVCFPKEILAISDDLYFKFVIDWNDEPGSSDENGLPLENEYTWLDWWKLQCTLPSDALYRDNSDSPDDLKFNIKELCKWLME